MKSRLLMIIGIVIAILVTIVLVSSLQNITKYNDDNIYKISAKIIRSEIPYPMMCPLDPCPVSHLSLSIKSETPIVLEEYLICNGFSCVKNEKLHHDVKYSNEIPLFNIESWQIGDVISIKIGASTLYDDSYTHHPPPMTKFIDLGESEIIEYGMIEPTDTSGHCGEKYLVVGIDTCILDPNLIEPNTVIIYGMVENGETRLAVAPSQMVMNLTNGNSVTFVNDGLTTVNIFDHSKGVWSFDNVKPSSQRTLIINETGFYEFLIQNSLHGQPGRIAALSDDTNSLPVGVRAKMAQTIIGSHFGETNDWLISVGAGGLNPGITIGIDEKFQYKYDDAKKFYYEKYRNMIPFDVPITIEFGKPIELQ